jgi:outer membrane protein TolC
LSRLSLAPSILASICSIMLLVSAAEAAGALRTHIPVSLVEATDLAIKERPEFQLELEKGKIARSKVREAKGSFLPTLDFQASSYYINNYDTFAGVEIMARIYNQNVHVNVTKDVPPYQLDSELDFSYNLFAGGRDRALYAEALNNLESERQREGSALRKIRLDVANAYWELKKARIQYVIARRESDVVRLEMKVAETKHQLHRISEVDYDAVVLKDREKEIAARTADRDCLRAFSSYLHALGIPEEHPPASSDQIPELLDNPGSDPSYVAESSSHPDIERLKSDLLAASERERAAKAENYPKVDFFAKYSTVGRNSDYYLDSWRDYHSDYFMIGLKVTFNLFNGFKTEERANQANAEIRVKKLELEKKKRDLAEAEDARGKALDTANDQLSLAMERSRLEEAREKAARSQLQTGRLSELEYRQKAVEAENAADRVTMARIDVALARNALEQMVLE